MIRGQVDDGYLNVSEAAKILINARLGGHSHPVMQQVMLREIYDTNSVKIGHRRVKSLKVGRGYRFDREEFLDAVVAATRLPEWLGGETRD